jgi:hypothetical protein
VARIRTSDAVVADLDLEDRRGSPDADAHDRGPGVFGGVRERLGHQVVGRDLDTLR